MVEQHRLRAGRRGARLDGGKTGHDDPLISFYNGIPRQLAEEALGPRPPRHLPFPPHHTGDHPRMCWPGTAGCTGLVIAGARHGLRLPQSRYRPQWLRRTPTKPSVQTSAVYARLQGLGIAGGQHTEFVALGVGEDSPG